MAETAMASGNQHRLKKKHYNAALLILNKLEKQALDGDTQAAAIYLRKIIPDLRSTELKGKIDSKMEITLRLHED